MSGRNFIVGKRTMRLRSALCGTVLGLLIPLLAVGPVLAQATLMPNAKQQYLDDAGNPVASGQVFYYTPSTTTKKTIWQDAAETTPQANPVLLDAAGRPQPAGQTYGSGCYQQKVVDQNSVQIWSAVTCSTGSGGSTSPAFSEGVMVGTILAWPNTTIPAKYLYAAGASVSRVTYPDLFTALTYRTSILCQVGIATITVSTTISDAMPVGGAVEASCFAPGTTVVSKSSGSLTLNNNATATISVNAVIFPWGNGDGSTTFKLPDLRGTVIAGRNNMPGPGISPRLSTAIYGSNPDANNSRGGDESSTLTTINLPAYTPTGTVTNGAISSVVTGGVNGGSGSAQFSSAGGTFLPSPATAIVVTSTQAASSFAGVAQGGTSTPVSRVQPTLTSDYVIKALPDDTPGGPGVSSIQGMTGAIACGTNVICTANTISVTIGVTSIQGMTGNLTCGAGLSCSAGVIDTASNNTYTILSPSGGNDTPQIQAAVNASNKTVLLSCGSYSLSSAVTVPAGGISLQGTNDNCVSINVTGNFYAITCSSRNARVNISALNFGGTAAAFNGTLNISDLGQGAISVVDCPYVNVTNVYVQNMSGSAFACQSPSSLFTATASPKVLNFTVFNSYHALHPSNACEYAIFTNIVARNNIFGALIEAGNVLLDGFTFTYNYTNLQVIGRTNPNPCHGTISNGEANHGVGFNLTIISCSVGMNVTNVNMIADGGGNLSAGGGLLNVYNSTGINIVGGQMGSNVNIVAADPVGGSTALSGPNRMSDVFVRTAIAGFTNPAIGYAGGLAIIDSFNSAGPWSQITSGTIASGALALATGAIASAACTSAQTAAATGTATTDAIQATFSGDPTAITGYIPSTSGMLTIISYPTANTVNFKVCNNTLGSITPGAVTVNWRVVR